MDVMQLQFSNPRRETVISDWPFGRRKVEAQFFVEKGRGGERVVRMTENKAKDSWNKPKKTTYCTKYVIVDGEDGKTYLLGWDRQFRSISVMSGNMKHMAAYFHQNDARYKELKSLILSVSEKGE